MDDLPTPSAESTASASLRPRPLNFSRPRPAQAPTKLHHDRSAANSSTSVHTIKAFHDPTEQTPALPAEPRFSLESDISSVNSDDTATPSIGSNSAASEFAWDGQLGELRSRQRPQAFEEAQRYTPSSTSSSAVLPPATRTWTNGSQASTTTTNTTSSTKSSSSSRPAAAPNGGILRRPSSTSTPAPPPIPPKHPKIVKRTSFDQHSEHLTLSSRRSSSASASSTTTTGTSTTSGWEDGASHHTVSIAGSIRAPSIRAPSTHREEPPRARAHSVVVPDSASGSSTSTGRTGWSSSDFDISGLSEKEVRKLRKKGINPALYAEMKAARKGKGKWVGPLVGNTYIG